MFYQREKFVSILPIDWNILSVGFQFYEAAIGGLGGEGFKYIIVECLLGYSLFGNIANGIEELATTFINGFQIASLQRLIIDG